MRRLLVVQCAGSSGRACATGRSAEATAVCAHRPRAPLPQPRQQPCQQHTRVAAAEGVPQLSHSLTLLSLSRSLHLQLPPPLSHSLRSAPSTLAVSLSLHFHTRCTLNALDSHTPSTLTLILLLHSLHSHTPSILTLPPVLQSRQLSAAAAAATGGGSVGGSGGSSSNRRS
jgi:hypothetical protein